MGRDEESRMIRFVRKDYPTVTSGLVITFRAYRNNINQTFEISASANGVSLNGSVSLNTFDETIRVHQLMKKAWQIHRNLASGDDPAKNTHEFEWIDESDTTPTFRK